MMAQCPGNRLARSRARWGVLVASWLGLATLHAAPPGADGLDPFSWKTQIPGVWRLASTTLRSQGETLKLCVYAPNVSPRGHRPWYVAVRTASGKSARRTHYFQFTLAFRDMLEGRTASSVGLVLEAGKAEARTSGILLPLTGRAWQIREQLNVRLDGGPRSIQLKFASSMRGVAAVRPARSGSAILIDRDLHFLGSTAGSLGAKTDGKIPDVRRLAVVLSGDDGSAPMTWTVPAARRWLANLRSIIDARSPWECPVDWRCYADHPAVVIAAPELVWWCEQGGRAWEALRRWVLAGGTLIVVGRDAAGDRRWLDARFREGSTAPSWEDFGKWYNSSQARDERNRAARGADMDYNLRMMQALMAFVRDQATRPKSMLRAPRRQKEENGAAPRETDRQSAGAWARRWGFGRIAYLTESSAGRLDQVWAFAVAGPGTRFSMSDNLITCMTEGRYTFQYDYYDELHFPGIGTPPIGIFLAVIGAFVALIGPVQFLFLAPRGARVRLLWMIPLWSFLAASAFLVVVLIRDGVTPVGQVRSLTYLDGPTGTAVTWSREAYYAPFFPGPLERLPESLVVPLRDTTSPLDQFTWERRGQREQFLWDDLRPRRLFALATAHVARTKRKVVVRPLGTGQIAVGNRLGTAIFAIVVRDREGNWYAGSRIEEGQVARLDAMPKADALRPMWELLKERIPVFQVTPAAGAGSGDFSEGETQTTGWGDTLDREIHRLLAGNGLPPGSFAALVARCPLTQRKAGGVQWLADIECVWGRW